MKTSPKFWSSSIPFTAFPVLAALLAISTSQSLKAEDKMVPLNIKLPEPAFKGTPKEIQLSKYVEPYDPDKKRPPFMVPDGVVNLVAGKKPSSSDTNATESILTKITDGDKEPSDQSIIYLRKGTQWIQFDLGSENEIYAILIWHAHNTPKVYHSVIAQFSDDPAFKDNVKTIYNNDQENKSGLGVGTDREYFESNEGRLIDAKGAKTRYVRLYSKGSTESALNEYTEVEIYGRPAK